MRPLFVFLLGLSLLSLSRPAAWADGPMVGANAVASWKNPTTTAYGNPLTDLAGIKLWIGTSSHTYTKSHNAGLASSVPLSALKLTDGQYYMAVQAYDTTGNVSSLSNEVPFVLQTSSATNSTGGTTTISSTITITNVVPRVGLPGTAVTIVGKNFLGATSVLFNGSSAKFTMVSNYVIRATVPVGATTGPVWVNTPAGTASSATVFTLPPPVLSGFAPLKVAPGKTVTIVGRYFSGTTAVTFNGNRATFTVASNYLIHATVPAGATDGPISVTTPYGTVTSGKSFDVP